MFHRKIHRGLQGLFAVGDVVVFLEARLQALEDLHAVGHGRLDHVDLLEAPRQRTILFEHAAEFLEGGGANATQLPGRQRRLDQVGRIHGAAGRRTRTDDGVDFIHEQDRLGVFLQLRDDGFQALLEITAVLGARNQRAKV
jgi:hypothetical protein